MAYVEPSTSSITENVTSTKTATWYAGNKNKNDNTITGNVSKSTIDTSLQYLQGSGWLSVSLQNNDDTTKKIIFTTLSENNSASVRNCRVYLKNSKYTTSKYILVSQNITEGDDDTKYDYTFIIKNIPYQPSYNTCFIFYLSNEEDVSQYTVLSFLWVIQTGVYAGWNNKECAYKFIDNQDMRTIIQAQLSDMFEGYGNTEYGNYNYQHIYYVEGSKHLPYTTDYKRSLTNNEAQSWMCDNSYYADSSMTDDDWEFADYYPSLTADTTNHTITISF